MTPLATIDERLAAIITELIQGGITYEQASSEFARKYVSVALRVTSGNVTQAAARIGVHRNMIHYRVRASAELREEHDARPRKSDRSCQSCGCGELRRWRCGGCRQLLCRGCSDAHACVRVVHDGAAPCAEGRRHGQVPALQRRDHLGED